MSTALATHNEDSLVEVLGSSLYPTASANSIKLVLSYCRAAGLDPMQKPVHIVPMWNGKLKCMQDVIMPGIGLYRTSANRTGQFAGMSEPEFGPTIEQTLDKQKFSFPEWCKITVRRQLASGHIGEFTAIEYWLENYAVKGGADKSTAPNAMWAKRPRGQLAKCAQAQALRAAFPELGALPTAEEMEGKAIEGEFRETTGSTSVAGQEFEKSDADTQDMLNREAAPILTLFETDQQGAYALYVKARDSFDSDTQVAFRSRFPSNVRTAFTKLFNAEKTAPVEA
jgi:phage recombination protein Bet